MIRNIIYRLALGVLFMLIAVVLCAITGLSAFFSIKVVSIIGFIFGVLSPNLLSDD